MRGVLTIVTVATALLLSRSKGPALRGRIGLAQSKRRVDPDTLKGEVTFETDHGTRHFIDSVAVGILRGLRSHLVVSDVEGVVEAAPPSDGSFVTPAKSAYSYIERANREGQYVCAPVSMGFDLPIRRIFQLTRQAPVGDPDLVVLLVPGAYRVFRPTVFDPELGG